MRRLILVISVIAMVWSVAACGVLRLFRVSDVFQNTIYYPHETPLFRGVVEPDLDDDATRG